MPAKVSRARLAFSQLIEDVRKNEFNATLTWEPDCMSLIVGNLGSLVDLMDKGKLLQIKTYFQVFTNNPNKKQDYEPLFNKCDIVLSVWVSAWLGKKDFG